MEEKEGGERGGERERRERGERERGERGGDRGREREREREVAETKEMLSFFHVVALKQKMFF